MTHREPYAPSPGIETLQTRSVSGSPVIQLSFAALTHTANAIKKTMTGILFIKPEKRVVI